MFFARHGHPAHGLAWDVTSTPDGEQWGRRLEIYHDEPGQDMNEWETELAFKLAGQCGTG
jgi:RNA polymerase sigma-70 factor, ECF subfamily